MTDHDDGRGRDRDQHDGQDQGGHGDEDRDRRRAYDLGDRNPSQGFTGGYGGGVADRDPGEDAGGSYATSGGGFGADPEKELQGKDAPGGLTDNPRHDVEGKGDQIGGKARQRVGEVQRDLDRVQDAGKGDRR